MSDTVQTPPVINVGNVNSGGESTPVKIGIIGGSGLDDPDILHDKEEKAVTTPFGQPSDVLTCGKIKGVPCVLLARHGKDHSIMPGKINYRANIYALKREGCTNLVVTSACGSLQEDIVPGQLLIPDQFIDMTKQRISTFYDGGPGAPRGVCHIPMNEPFCPHMRKILQSSCNDLGYTYHPDGTVLTIEGPRFSSRAESVLWHSWGVHLINMTLVPEVVLAKEAGLPYASICMATDYDSWLDTEEHVSVEVVLKTFKENADKAKQVLLNAVPKIAAMDWSKIIAGYESQVYTSIMGME